MIFGFYIGMASTLYCRKASIIIIMKKKYEESDAVNSINGRCTLFYLVCTFGRQKSTGSSIGSTGAALVCM